MTKRLAFLGALAAGVARAAVPTVDSSTLALAFDGNTRIVTVTYDLKDAPGIVTADFLTNGVSVGAENFQNVWGDVNCRLDIGDGKKFHWPAGNDWPGHLIEEGTLSVALTAWATNAPPPFVAVNVAVSNAIPFFYACEAAVPGGVTNSLYKTDCILLKRVNAAGVKWRMGSYTWESGRETREVAHDVMLTNDYCMGVYPVTQRQFLLAVCSCGGVDAVHSNVKNGRQNIFGGRLDSDMRPAEYMGWSDLRGKGGTLSGTDDDGYNWPADGHKVNPKYFLGKLRAAKGIEFDLPTEAQWEYACRAGSTDTYNVENANLGDLAWYKDNSAVEENGEEVRQTHPVGMKKPNAWGFYDMHGNVAEWCLDWWAAYTENLDKSPVLEPVGITTPTSNTRVRRGGTFDGEAKWCRSAAGSENKWSQAAQNANSGFRLCCPIGVR